MAVVPPAIDVWFRNLEIPAQTPHVFRGILAELRRRYPTVEFRHVDPRELGLSEEILNWPGSPASSHMLRLVNPACGAHTVVSFWDCNVDPLRRHMGWEPALLRQLIASSGITEAGYEHHKASGALAETRPLATFHTPFTYNIYRHRDATLLDVHRLWILPAADREPGLCFRGYIYDLRTELIQHLPADVVKVIDMRTDGALDPEDYFAELARHRLAFSLNGAGEICNRDMEILGLGLPLFRPELRCQFHEPLVPGVHYISACRAPDIAQNGTFRYSDPAGAAEEIITNCLSWQDNPAALERIGRNGRAWYVRNVLPERQVALACDLIDLARLNY